MYFQITLLLEIKNSFVDSTSMVVSEKTIKRELHQSGYFCRVDTRKPYVNVRNENKEKRIYQNI